MHAFIVPKAPDLPPSPDTYILTPDTATIGIDHVRAVQHYLSRKSMTNRPRTVIVNSAHTLTLPAQHAFLKTLEEPPPDTSLYLVTSQPDMLLPTILSRCQLTSGVQPQPQELIFNPDHIDLFQRLAAAEIGERLILLDTAKLDRESALKFLDAIEHHLHTQIQIYSQLSIAHYQLLVDTKKYLRANCNVRLTMDHFALHITSSSSTHLSS